MTGKHSLLTVEKVNLLVHDCFCQVVLLFTLLRKLPNNSTVIMVLLFALQRRGVKKLSWGYEAPLAIGFVFIYIKYTIQTKPNKYAGTN